MSRLLIGIALLWSLFRGVQTNKAAEDLYAKLLTNYNRLVRPVTNDSQTVTVLVQLRLFQLIDVHEKGQIMTTNVWLYQKWHDYKMVWTPSEYDNIEYIQVPSELIWLPDIVLYNNADGDYQITIRTKATLYFNGTVTWEPPAIYKSMCEMDIEWYPYDEQICKMKFGSWSYDGAQVDLVHWRDWHADQVEEHDLGAEKKMWRVKNSIDLLQFHPSVEWDIIAVPGERHSAYYPCCNAPFVDITYYLHLRRKTLFYTLNLIVPCVGISFLTQMVFYLPADSCEKVTLSISILISMTVFFLLLVELIPSTSLVIPMIGKYLLFTMSLVTLSVACTVFTLRIQFRSHDQMAPWIRRWFLDRLPRLLQLDRLTIEEQRQQWKKHAKNPLLYQLPFVPRVDIKHPGKRDPMSSPFAAFFLGLARLAGRGETQLETNTEELEEFEDIVAPQKNKHLAENIQYAAKCLDYIVALMKRDEEKFHIDNDWKFVAMVIDRVFQYIFSIAIIIGACTILLRAPAIRDYREPLSNFAIE